ncbi:hypothetical protein SAZ10_33170 [Mesorhizobium sp. BAC0120]|nr:hypothetical protein [Mesorhizobium sp. BAC0120]MDW6026624.1 hypothetical protein [Mesorhizobium sp. BAC0120]
MGASEIRAGHVAPAYPNNKQKLRVMPFWNDEVLQKLTCDCDTIIGS